MSLTKDEIVEAVAEETDFLKNRSAEIVESLIEVIKRSLESGEDVLISSFGKFCVKEKHERKGRNPATGKDVKIEARRVVTFKCSRKLRDEMSESL